jgi:hypothetical protein
MADTVTTQIIQDGERNCIICQFKCFLMLQLMFF